MNLKRAVQPQKAHKAHKKSNSNVVRRFTNKVTTFLALRICLFYVNFVTYVANCRF